MEEIEFKIIECSWERNNRVIIATEDMDLIIIDYPKNSRNYGYIWNFWVNKEKRNQGLGRKLMAKALEHIKVCGGKTAELEWCRADTPIWVLAWYQRLGFEKKSFGNKYVRLVKKL